MASRYELLPPDADYIEIARICRLCVAKMHERVPSYPKIAAEISRHAGDAGPVNGPSLKTFVTRVEPRRINASNNTLATLYNYLHSEVRQT